MRGNFDWSARQRPAKPRGAHIPNQLPFKMLDELLVAYKRSVTPEEYTRLCHHVRNGGSISLTITIS